MGILCYLKLFEADKIYQGTSLINPGTGPGVDTPLRAIILGHKRKDIPCLYSQ